MQLGCFHIVVDWNKYLLIISKCRNSVANIPEYILRHFPCVSMTQSSHILDLVTCYFLYIQVYPPPSFGNCITHISLLCAQHEFKCCISLECCDYNYSMLQMHTFHSLCNMKSNTVKKEANTVSNTSLLCRINRRRQITSLKTQICRRGSKGLRSDCICICGLL